MIRPDEKPVVKDSSGIVYPFAIWQKLLQTGGYTLRRIDANASPVEFLLVQLTEEERLKIIERLPPPRESKFFVTGKPVGNVRIEDMNGKKYKLKELKGKIVVLNFWFINCPPCRMEIPELNKMVKAYEGRDDILFLAVALDPDFALKEFLADTPFNYTIVDRGSYIASQYGITSYPTHLVIDREGKAVFHTSGYGMSTVHWLKKAIDNLLSPHSIQNPLPGATVPILL